MGGEKRCTTDCREGRERIVQVVGVTLIDDDRKDIEHRWVTAA